MHSLCSLLSHYIHFVLGAIALTASKHGTSVVQQDVCFPQIPSYVFRSSATGPPKMASCPFWDSAIDDTEALVFTGVSGALP